MSLAMLFRTSCTSCGSKVLRWFTSGPMILQHLPLSHQDEARKMFDWYGNQPTEAWMCGKCDHFGIVQSGSSDLGGPTLI